MRLASRRSVTSPAPRKIAKCREIDGPLIENRAAISPAGLIRRQPLRRRPRTMGQVFRLISPMPLLACTRLLPAPK